MTYNPNRFPRFDVVAYHANCTDGLTAAAVVLNFMGHLHSGQFVPIQYGQPLPEAIAKGGENIIFVDFCPELEQIPEIQKAWKDWFVIDHHKSRDWIAQAHPDNAVFVDGKCGAALTWEWFAPGRGLPAMIAFVQDRDLWQWRLPLSREVSAGLAEEERDVAHFRFLLNNFDSSALITKGDILLTRRTRAARSLAEKAYSVGSDYGDGFYAVNATADVSEVCEEMLKLYPEIQVACAWFAIGPHEVQLSFRSRSHAPHYINALGMAKYFGGGGHEHAAGAKMSMPMWSRYLENVGHLREPEPVPAGSTISGGEKS